MSLASDNNMKNKSSISTLSQLKKRNLQWWSPWTILTSGKIVTAITISSSKSLKSQRRVTWLRFKKKRRNFQCNMMLESSRLLTWSTCFFQSTKLALLTCLQQNGPKVKAFLQITQRTCSTQIEPKRAWVCRAVRVTKSGRRRNPTLMSLWLRLMTWRGRRKPSWVIPFCLREWKIYWSCQIEIQCRSHLSQEHSNLKCR